MSIICVKDINVEDIIFTGKHKNKGGGEAVYVSYNNNPKFVLQTDKIYCNSGIIDNNYIEIEIDNSLFGDVVLSFETKIKDMYENDDNCLRSCITDNKIKLGIQNNKNFKTTIYTSDKKELDSINVSINLQCLIHVAGIWFKNNEYGISWKLLQIKTYDKELILDGYSFLDDGIDVHDVIPDNF